MTTFADILGGPRSLVASGLSFAYRPDAVTPALLARILRGAEAAETEPMEALAAYRDTIPAFVVSWDLVNEGEPVPLTPDGIDTVPLAILDLVFEAIMEDRTERASEEGKDSSASTDGRPRGSTIPTSTEILPNGSATSTLPVSSA